MSPDGMRVTGAFLEEPTGRYGHDVLGGNEYARLRVVWRQGGVRDETVITLPEDRVFEDVAARPVDLFGTGAPNAVMVVEASREAGAALTFYAPDSRGGLARIAAPPIGRAFRWLGPVGSADFDGDGRPDFAYVETPHLGGTLRIWTLKDGALSEIAAAPGFSNHRIGQDFITGGVRDCGEGPEIVLPSFDWRSLRLVRLGKRGLEDTLYATGTAPETVAAALECR